MENQLDLFKGNKLRDLGINQASENADDKYEEWSNLAYEYLLQYIKQNKRFMAEEIRVSSVGVIPDPPSNRAWGAIIVRAKKAGLIKSVGTAGVKNPKAHRAICNIWEVIS